MRFLLPLALYCLFAIIPANASNEEPLSASLIQLIGNPEKFEGKLVRVSGYLHDKFEDHNLFLSKEDGDLLRTMNAIGVDYAKEVELQPNGTSRKDVDCSQVLLEGIFRSNANADFSPASLNNVRRVLIRTRHYDGKKEFDSTTNSK